MNRAGLHFLVAHPDAKTGVHARRCTLKARAWRFAEGSNAHLWQTRFDCSGARDVSGRVAGASCPNHRCVQFRLAQRNDLCSGPGERVATLIVCPRYGVRAKPDRSFAGNSSRPEGERDRFLARSRGRAHSRVVHSQCEHRVSGNGERRVRICHGGFAASQSQSGRHSGWDTRL